VTDLFSLKGKRVLVTGGTRGIGRAISVRFARAGADIIANYVRDRDSAESLCALGAAEGLALEAFRADLSSPTGTDKLIEHVKTRWESLSILVHCAATGVHKPVEQLTLRHFDWTFGLNTRAFFDLVIRLIPFFDKRGASVLALSSDGAVRAVPQYALVGASKAALESLVRHMAAELAGHTIRVNALSSGPVPTDAWKSIPEAEQRLSEARRRSPSQRLNTLEEVAWAAQFICSDAASGVVGQTLVVDAGLRILP
jgi:NAD(P)-dependent dehydrogenase (short-subunit alcohol dehydrogenase family)